MKGSENVKMTINIGGELINLVVDFNEQIDVRDTEKAIKLYLDRLKKQLPDESDRFLLAYTAYQFARSYHQMLKLNEEALEFSLQKSHQIDEFLASKKNINED